MPGSPLSLDQVPHPFHHHLHHGGHHLPADRRRGLGGEWDGYLHLDQVSFIIHMSKNADHITQPFIDLADLSFFKQALT